MPALTVRNTHDANGDGDTALVHLASFDTINGEGATVARGVPVRRVGEHLVCTVFDLMLAQYGVARPGLPGEWPTGYDDPTQQNTPAWQEAITGVSAAQAIRVAKEFARSAEESGGRSMIIMGSGICQWFHGDAIYRAVLALLMLTGSMGRNGGGWAHYVGQEKVRPLTGFQTMAMATDWVRPPRQVPGASYWYAHTDQWRYDGYGADKLASPLGRGRFAGKHTMDLLAMATAMGWSPFYPQFDRSSLDVADEARDAGRDAADYVAEQLRDRKLKLSVTDPDNPVNWPRVLTVWRANLIGSSGKGGEYFLRHLLGTDSNVQAEPPTGRDTARRCGVRGRHPRGQARPDDVDRLPDDLDDAGLRCGAAGGDLVREGRHFQHGHAPVRARVQCRDRSAVGNPLGLRGFRRDRARFQRAWPSGTWVSAATWSSPRCSTTLRTRWPIPTAPKKTGCTPARRRYPGGRCPNSPWWNAITAPSTTNGRPWVRSSTTSG